MPVSPAQTQIAGELMISFGGKVIERRNTTIGGGMQTAAIAHAVKLTRLLFDLDVGINKTQALTSYKGVFEDTLVWLQEGLVEFYPTQKEQTVARAFNKSFANGETAALKILWT